MRRPKNLDLRDKLRALPIDQRAQLIVEVFQIIAGEFAAMVLEHVKPARAGKVKRGKKRRPRRLAGVHEG